MVDRARESGYDNFSFGSGAGTTLCQCVSQMFACDLIPREPQELYFVFRQLLPRKVDSSDRSLQTVILSIGSRAIQKPVRAR